MNEKKHSILSASGAHRWLYCTPSALLEQQFPEEESEYAAEGTLEHDLCEIKLRHYFFTKDVTKRVYNAAVKTLKKNELWKDEMEGYADVYLNYVKEAALAFQSLPYVAVEKRVYFGAYTCADPEDENEGYGTADCILISGGTIHVIDNKYGQSPNGRVSAEGNPQLSLYALGAYEAYKLLYPIDTVELSIVQPRLPDGISHWKCSVDELLAFGEFVKRQAALARAGEGPCSPGPHTCRFCRARSKCRARADENVKLAFQVGKEPPLISNEEVGRYLQQGEDVAKWLSDLKEYALSECLAGRDVPGWKAVEGRSVRKWTDMDAAFERLIQTGTPEQMLYEKTPLTLAAVEKLVGKKAFAEAVGEYVAKAPGKPALAAATDPRAAITNKITAEEAFKGKEGETI